MKDKNIKIIVGVLGVVIAGMVAVLFILSPTNKTQRASGQIIKSGDIVEVDYVGTLENGEIFDQSASTTPLQFTVGEGQMISGFDEAVVGMQIGETKNITLSPEKAYGTTTTVSLLEKVPLELFKMN